jgi:6-phosphogluconate dehydrogenase
MMAVWILCGVAGSGKSSLAQALARELDWRVLDADDFHPPANREKMRAGQPLTEADREPWLRAMEQALHGVQGNLLLAFPGLKAAHRARLAAAAPGAHFAFLKVSPETARQRLLARGGFFPASLVESQFADLEDPVEALELDGELDRPALLERALRWLRPGQAGLVGLGRMGLGLGGRLADAGFEVLAYDQDAAARERAQTRGLKVFGSLEALAAAFTGERRVLLSLPAGEATLAVAEALMPRLSPQDLLVDASNGHWKQSQALAGRGFDFVDAGVSGGLRGAVEGYCVMAGGSPAAYARAYPLFHALAAPGGLVHCGPAGSGHFTKMAHNGIEYGMMQAYGEGFELLASQPGLPLGKIAEAWRHGAVVRSWLLDLSAEALKEDPSLARFTGRVGENSTGRWAADAAQERGLEMPALQAALEGRRRSRERPGFAGKLLSALREKFGGHAEA